MQALLLLAERHDSPLSSQLMIVIIVVAVALAIGGRLVHGALDRGRIRAYADANGWELLSCRWSPFGPGWFGARRERIYAIEYRDREGGVHQAYAKTALFGGVYLTEGPSSGGGAA